MSHTDQSGAAANTLNTGSSVGDCAIDTFVVTSGGGGNSSPVICGINSNQHSEYCKISKYLSTYNYKITPQECLFKVLLRKQVIAFYCT